MCQKCIDQVELLLKAASKQRRFDTPQQEVAWQRGYLTGLFVNYMHEDARIKQDVAHIIHDKK
jgi:hypothetical protein